MITQPLKDVQLYEELDKQFEVDIRELHDRARRIAECAKYCQRKYSRETAEDGTMSMRSVLLYRLVPRHTEPVPPGLGSVDQWDSAVVHRELFGGVCKETFKESVVVRVPAQLVVDAIDFRLEKLRQNRREEISRPEGPQGPLLGPRHLVMVTPKPERVLESLKKRRADTIPQENCYNCAFFMEDVNDPTGKCSMIPPPVRITRPQKGCSSWFTARHGCASEPAKERKCRTCEHFFCRYKSTDGAMGNWLCVLPGKRPCDQAGDGDACCEDWVRSGSVKKESECERESTSPERQEEIARANRRRKQWKCDSCVHADKTVIETGWCGRPYTMPQPRENGGCVHRQRQQYSKQNRRQQRWGCTNCAHADSTKFNVSYRSLGWCTAGGYRTHAGLNPVCANQLLPVTGLDPEKVTVE